MKHVIRIVCFGMLTVIADKVHGQDFRYRVVALTDKTAVPNEVGLTFRHFDEPIVNQAGDVAFFATYFTPATVGSGVGLFTDQGSGLTEVASTTVTPIPGSADRFSFFEKSVTAGPDFFDAVMTDDGRIYFPAQVFSGPTRAAHGVWTFDDGKLATVAMLREAIPDGTAEYDGFSEEVVAHSTAATFRASHTKGLSVFRVDGQQQVTEVIREGAPIPGTNREITSMGWPSISPGESIFIQVADRVSRGAILRQTNDMLTPIVASGEPVPNSIFQIIEAWADFGINAREDVAFGAVLTQDRRGLFIKSSEGQLATLALSGEFVPGAESGFIGFGSPLINGQGVVAFVGSYPGGQGIFAWDDGTITDIALPDLDDAPGAQSPYSTIDRPALNSSNKIVFRADLKDGTSGVWMSDPLGRVQPIVLAGQTWDIDGVPGGESRTVRTVYFDGESGGQDGRGSGLNDRELALTIAFADNTEGVYVLTVPEPRGWLTLFCGAILTKFFWRSRIFDKGLNVRSPLRVLLLAIILTSVWRVNRGHAQSVWLRPTGGSWTAAENWSGPVPNAPGDTARFAESNPTRQAQIVLDSPVTIGQLLVANPRTITITGDQPLSFDAGDRSSPGLVELTRQAAPLRIAAPVELSQPGLRVKQGDVAFTGQVRGSGGLTIDGARVRLTGNNLYAGPNRIQSGELVIESTNALGSAPGQAKSVTTVGQSGKLIVDLGLGGQVVINDDLQLEGGIIEFRGHAGVRPATASVRGVLSVAQGTTGTVRLSPPHPVETFQQAVDFRGVTGDGGLDIESELGHGTIRFLSEPVEIGGELRIRHGVSIPRGGEFLESHVDVEFNVPVAAKRLTLDDDQAVSLPSDIRPPLVDVRFNQDAEFQSIVLDGLHLSGRSLIFSDAEQLDSRKGVIALDGPGRFDGVSRIVKSTSARGELQNLGDASEIVEVDVQAGNLAWNNVQNSRDAIVRISRPEYAGITVSGTVDSTVDLNNATGIGSDFAALVGDSSSSIVTGDIDLGNVGSGIGGFRLEISGQISGGNLDVVGDIFATGVNTYTGTTTVRATPFTFAKLEVLGSIASSPEIIVGNNAFLVAGPQSLHPNVRLDLRGGFFGVAGSGNSGTLVASSGNAIVLFQDPSQVRFQSLEHVHGGTLHVILRNDSVPGGISDEDPRLLFEQLPSAENRILGGWFTVEDQQRVDFAAYDPQQRGLHPLSPIGRPGQVEGASAGDNVLAENAMRPLIVDTTINSLNINLNSPGFDRFDLRGNLLTIQSGGLLLSDVQTGLPSIVNGRLTSGGSNLYVNAGRRRLTIEASIVDNSQPMAVTFSGDTVVSGENRYSGTTTVLGNHTVLRPEAIPRGGDVTVHGVNALLDLQYNAAVPVELGTILLKDLATIKGPAIRAAEYQFEAGYVDAPLVGDGPFRKLGPGVVNYRTNGSMRGFSGPVIVDDGTLVASEDNGLLGSGPVTINGGRVVFSGRRHLRNTNPRPTRIDNPIFLSGGDLAAGWDMDGDITGKPRFDAYRFSGPVQVNGDSTILTYAPGFFIGGNPESLTRISSELPSSITLTNTVTLTEDATLRKLGPGPLQVSGPILVSANTSLVVEEESVILSGDIISDHNTATLNVIQTNPDESSWTLTGSIRVKETHHLQLQSDGAPLEVQLAERQSLSGGGVLENTVLLQNGASVAPGDGVGKLDVAGDVTLAQGSVYQWQIRDATGEAGSAAGWDLLQVRDTLRFSDAFTSPFILRVMGLAGDGNIGAVTGFDPQAAFSWPIATASAFDGFDNAVIQIDVSSFTTDNPVPPTSRFLLIAAESGDLLLQYKAVDRLCDVNADGQCDALDIDALSLAIVQGVRDVTFDLNQDGAINGDDRIFWVEQLANTWFGDANLDGKFDQRDLVSILQAGQYEDGLSGNGRWQFGDFNGDREVDRFDMILALQSNGYLQGPRQAISTVSVVPEPSSWILLLLGLTAGVTLSLQRRKNR